MKVTKKITMRAYNTYTMRRMPKKIPVMPNGRVLKRDSQDWRLRLGDSIYDFGKERISQRIGVHRRENRRTNLSGKYALLSRDFVYFGDQAIPLPRTLKGILHNNQGHRSALNAPYRQAFLSWWRANSKTFSKNRVRGVPQWDAFANRRTLGACANAHMKEAERDNRLCPS
jgi:hypothetical protein